MELRDAVLCIRYVAYKVARVNAYMIGLMAEMFGGSVKWMSEGLKRFGY